MRRGVLFLGFVLLLGLTSCGLRVDDETAGNARRSTSTAARSLKPGATIPTATTTTPAGARKPSTTVAQVGGPPSTAASGGGSGDLAEFCDAAKKVEFTNLANFAVIDSTAAASLVFRFDKAQKLAPAELKQPFAERRAVLDEQVKQIKQGTIRTLDDLNKWIADMNRANPDPVVKAAKAHVAIVEFMKAHCT